MSENIISFDYDIVQGQRLNMVVGRDALKNNDESTSYDEIRFILEDCHLIISVTDDTDELMFSYQEISSDTSRMVTGYDRIPSLDTYLGKSIGWAWLGKNHLGYQDIIILSFSGIEPSVTMSGMASKINIYVSVKK